MICYLLIPTQSIKHKTESRQTRNNRNVSLIYEFRICANTKPNHGGKGNGFCNLLTIQYDYIVALICRASLQTQK